MIFRKENRGESFQRQISNLRQQLQPDIDDEPEDSLDDEHEAKESTETQTTSWDDNRGTSHGSELTPTSSFPVAEQPASPRPSWQTADATTSIIASNATWNGTLQSEGSLHIHGRAEGELYAANDLVIAEGAKVDAEVFAENVVVAGIVRGRIEARNRLEVLSDGHVAGDIKAQKLVIHEGARLAGQLRMGTTSASTSGTSTAQSSGTRQSKPQHGSR